jgi:hypothetical protein
MPQSEAAVPGEPRPAPWQPLAWLVALTFALVAYGLFSWDRDFPYFYHTDEPSKVLQILGHEYNFHHPLLLLRTTEALIAATGTPLRAQPAVERGRQASAIFAAVSVGALVLLAWRLAGWKGGTLAGILAGTHPALFELSHYMKEDCALLVGITVTAAALVAFADRPTLWRAALVGLGAGLALSGKYLGGAIGGTALLAVGLTRPQFAPRWLAVVVACVGLAACFAAINYPSLCEPERVKQSFREELVKVEKRAEERTEGIKFKHLSKLGTSLSAPLLAGLGYWLVRRWRQRAAEPIAWRVLGGFVLGFFLLVSLAPKTKDRYLLPVYTLSCALGAAGLVEWQRCANFSPATALRGKMLRWAAPAVAVIAVGWHVPELTRFFRAFADDDRQLLTEWLRIHVPPPAGIAHDVRALLTRAREAHDPEYELANPL